MTKRILLTGIFKPCGVDDAYGRKENKAELFHNQITLNQGIFSVRRSTQTFGLHLIANNITHPTTVLDWPTLDLYQKELAKGYDYIGIGFITPNLMKMKRMVELARELSPHSKIIIGGFGTAIEDIENLVDVDYVCRGEGIRFMRNLLGEPPEFEFRHPVMGSNVLEFMGIPIYYISKLLKPPGIRTFIPALSTGLGCVHNCDFCITSHFFECRYLPFMRRGQEIFDEMIRQEKIIKETRFGLIGDENFLSDKTRAEELRNCMRDSKRLFTFTLAFASADFLKNYEPEFLAELGIDRLWIGIESQIMPFSKNEGINLKGMMEGLRKYGIKTILSSILCLKGHTKSNIREDIELHLSLRPTFSQFALLSPLPGTPLWQRLIGEGRIIHSLPWEDRHAMKQIWFNHPEFSLRESENIQKEAYTRDYEELGPSCLREFEINFDYYLRFKDSKNWMLKERAERMKNEIVWYPVMCAAAEYLVPTPEMRKMVKEFRKKLRAELGRMSIFQRMESFGVYLFGKLRGFRYTLFGETVQPLTWVTHYN